MTTIPMSSKHDRFNRFTGILLGLFFLASAHAEELCSSKIYISRDCVPNEIVQETINGSNGVPFHEVVRTIYSRGVTALEKKNTPLFETGNAPEKILVSSNLALTVGLFGKDYETLRQGQQLMFASFCEKNGGKIKASGILPIVPKPAGYKESTLGICYDNKGAALGGLTTIEGVDGQLRLERLFAYYLSAAQAQSVLDFRSDIKPGDKPQFGLVIDLRGPLARVQVGNDERWYEIDKLVPQTLRELSRY